MSLQSPNKLPTESVSVPRHETGLKKGAEPAESGSHYQTIQLTKPDPRLEPLMPGERMYVPLHKIADFAKARVELPATQTRGGHDPEYLCYKTKGGWVPELRPILNADPNEAQGLRKRVEAVFDRPEEHVTGISSRRGAEEVNKFRRAYGELIGERMDPRTKHLLPELNVRDDGDGWYAQAYHTLRTSEKRPTVLPADINSRKLTFESVPTDVVSKAVFDPAEAKWTVQTVPYQELNSDVWQKQYGDGPITGSVATQREDGIYVLAFDEHVNRFVTDLENMGFPNVDREMVVEMMEEHLAQDANWVPNADNKFGNRYYLRAKGKSIKYSPALSGPYKELSLAGTPVGDFKVARGERVSVRLMGKRPVVEQNANRKAETAYEGPVSQLVAANQERLENGKDPYHEALFMNTRLKPNGTPDTYEQKTELQEGASANVAVILVGKNGEITIKTPDPKECGVLPGITVKLALELAQHQGWQTEYGVVSERDMENATEVFMTGTAMGIREVGLVDGEKGPVYRSGTGDIGKYTEILIDGYEAILAGTHPDPRLNAKMKRVVAFPKKKDTKH